MYLKSITVKGFKSFPDRCKLEFGPGVSVIVGPNGSGKSNVTDAVLWALGEQSPGAVRGQSMQDVIFAGATGRQAAGVAEVELTLDDSEGILALGTPEISILRRLDRNGEGEYRLAGAKCRLVDVIELLSDTGLGKEMHSVISQGRVESIVTSKPRDRRLLIEEAAGLGKHRKRRRRAQLKLERTQENLDRALDVEREARSRLRPLKRQAEAAELHARLERQSLEIQWELTRDQLRARRLSLTEAESAAAVVRAQRAQLERELEAVAARREAAEEALAARSALREELTRRSYTARAAAERVGYRREAAKGSADAIERHLARATEVASALRIQVAEHQPDPDADARIAELVQALAALDRDREAELTRQLLELEAQRAAAADAVAAAADTAEERGAEREAAEADVEQVRARLREAERAVEETRREAARVGGELAAVNQFLRNQIGAPGGADSLADALDVDAGYERAATAALDGRLRAAVVEEHEQAAALLDRAGDEGGHALIADPGLAEDEPVVPEAAVPGGERLLDHVHARGPSLALIRALLRHVWVIDDLAALPAGFEGVAVTRAGRVWSAPTRELRQAPAIGEDRVLAERNRRQGLIQGSEAAVQAEIEARAALERAAAVSAAADSERDRATADHRQAVRVLDEAREAQRRIAALIEHRRAAPDEGPNAGRRSQLNAELAAERQMQVRAERECEERQARVRRVQTAIAADRELAPAVAGVIAALDGAAEAIEARRAAFEADLAADHQAGEDVARQLRECAQQEAGLHAQLHRCSEALTEAEVRLERARDRAAECDQQCRALASRLGLEPGPAKEELPADERETLTARFERLQRRREQLGPVNPLAQEEYAEALAHVEELESQRIDLETALRELEKLIADTDKQIRSTFEQTFAATAQAFEELAAQLFPGGSGRLRLVAERSGPARTLGGEAPPPDADGSGGDGDAEPDEPELDEPEAEEDLLGVEIEITPAGKECKRLSLLSGGEKSMTALAFLFAVFLARPCPFYILDEVEAALDDLNIDRFLALLRQYSARAQFIVVTHQKRTMEAADFLYGVSMGADGISKVISRRLEAEQAA